MKYFLDDCQSCAFELQGPKQRHSSPGFGLTKSFLMHFVCLSVHHGAHLILSAPEVDPHSFVLMSHHSFSVWIIENYSPSQQDLPSFTPCEIWPGSLNDGEYGCVCVSDHVYMLCVPSRWTWPGSIGTASQILATATVGGTASASVRPLLHMHTNAVSRGSRYTGDRPLFVVSLHTET